MFFIVGNLTLMVVTLGLFVATIRLGRPPRPARPAAPSGAAEGCTTPDA